ncbi:MAG: S-adenosyl-l-methionine hydroxide adenosyltransferase family protein [Candidatus Bathyarchaeota archaeon]
MVVITLLTDYGIKDSYVAEMKGAILKILPDAILVDISHDVGNYSIDEGAFHIARSVPYFPEGTVHVGVVDPTVGSKRRAIIIKVKGAWLVGPDNGLLAPAAERLGVEKVYEIKNRELLPEKVSDVFDGRDTFGPTGALLAKGVSPEGLGPEIDGYVRLPLYEPQVMEDSIEAKVIHVDGFGNLVTNVTYEILERLGVGDRAVFDVGISGEEYSLPYVRRFSAVPQGEPLLLVAGGGYMELAVNQGDAQEMFGIDRGEKILFSLK